MTDAETAGALPWLPLGRILDRLHAMAMERTAAGEDFTPDWAGSTFRMLCTFRTLYNHAIGHPLEGRPPKDGKKAAA